MATGHTYEEVMEKGLATKAFHPEDGCSREYSILEALGLKQSVHFRVMWHGVLDPNWFKDIAWGRRAIMSVPSLNKENGWHSIYWTGAEIVDPSGQKTYAATDWARLKPREIIIFNEVVPT